MANNVIGNLILLSSAVEAGLPSDATVNIIHLSPTELEVTFFRGKFVVIDNRRVRVDSIRSRWSPKTRQKYAESVLSIWSDYWGGSATNNAESIF